MHVERSQDNFRDSFLSLYHKDPEDETQVIRLGGKHPYLLRHPNSPTIIIFWLVFCNVWD